MDVAGDAVLRMTATASGHLHDTGVEELPRGPFRVHLLEALTRVVLEVEHTG